MNRTLKIWLPNEQKTADFAFDLAKGLYRPNVTLFLDGPLGSGKTTFVRALARHLGVESDVTSPTYALEQRHESGTIPLTHIDLYRLSPAQSLALAQSSEEVRGIRCIEWANRLPEAYRTSLHSISLQFAETDRQNERMIETTFADLPLPSSADVSAWRTQMRLPAHIAAHCDCVAEVCVRVCEELARQGRAARSEALYCAGQLHDLLRFIDFIPTAAPVGTPNDVLLEPHWQMIRQRYPSLKHEQAAAAFLAEKGYPELGLIVSTHGLSLPSPPRPHLEQAILYYADKRALGDRLATLTERFDDFAKRYTKGVRTEESLIWEQEAKQVEKMLFPDGAPF